MTGAPIELGPLFAARTPRCSPAHVWPRYNWEPEKMVARPVWLYPPERWSDHASELDEQHDALRSGIACPPPHGERLHDSAPPLSSSCGQRHGTFDSGEDRRADSSMGGR